MKLRWSDIVASALAGLALGAIVHIVIVLRIPAVARHDAFSQLALAGADGVASPVPEDFGAPGAMGADPLTPRSACAWNLDDGPARITMPASGLPQTLSIHDRSGRVIYALTDRAAVNGYVALTVMTPAQKEERELFQPEDSDEDIIEVVSPTPRGLAVARAIPASPAWRERAVEATLAVTCQPEE
ncbi:hypothetical protein ACFFJB_05330 [Camelimonas abortus]|uniref:DUF1254 domain-containing protein n=1 Tax=Camelimonas abortus TaxID=1017184 RepID=A0ABV7LHK9_9HYPH